MSAAIEQDAKAGLDQAEPLVGIDVHMEVEGHVERVVEQ